MRQSSDQNSFHLSCLQGFSTSGHVRGTPLYNKELRGIAQAYVPWESSTLWKMTKDPVS
jgi:hypothetical protein